MAKKDGKKCGVSNCGRCGRYVKLEKVLGSKTHYCEPYCFTGEEFKSPPSFCKLGVLA